MTGVRMLGAYPYDPVRVACRRCDRRGQYRRSSLVALYGEAAPLPYVLRQLAQDCPKRTAIGNEACGAYFPDLLERPPGGLAGCNARTRTPRRRRER